MLRVCFSQGSRTIAVASTSSCTSLLHTSAVVRAGSRRLGGTVKKLNLKRKEERLKEALANRPSVVLGTRPSEEAVKWRNCDLAKVLVDEEELVSSTVLQPTEIPGLGTVNMPQQLAFGVAEAEKQMLFETLPSLSAQAGPYERSRITAVHQHAHELEKANAFAKVLDLRNANAAGIAFENRRRIIIAFSGPENPFNTGRDEVQAALLTYKIRKLWSHLTSFKRDVGNRLGLRKLVHQRAKILKHLKGVDRDRYDTVLQRLALEPEGVEGELVV